jgi:predicted nicotinamide N-methyase
VVGTGDGAVKLPLEYVELAIGGRLWHIQAVLNQDALLEMADQLAHIPYGFLLWESAVGLASMLAEQPDLVAGKRVLELGAGTGLPGLVARSLGATVWQTDHEERALVLAQANAAQNGVAGLQHFVADWRTWAHDTQYDVILGADILYERAMHPYLAPIFRQNLAPGGCLLLADPSRPQALEFIAALETQGWQFTITMQTVTLPTPDNANNPVEVALLVGTLPV